VKQCPSNQCDINHFGPMQRKSVFIFETSLEEDKHGLHNECEIIIIAIFPKKTQCIKEIWPNNKKKGVALLF